MCYRTLSEPVTMRPCGHSFCKVRIKRGAGGVGGGGFPPCRRWRRLLRTVSGRGGKYRRACADGKLSADLGGLHAASLTAGTAATDTSASASRSACRRA